jgi:hypothetical protein
LHGSTAANSFQSVVAPVTLNVLFVISAVMYQHKVALAIGLAIILVAVAVAAAVTLLYFFR